MEKREGGRNDKRGGRRRKENGRRKEREKRKGKKEEGKGEEEGGKTRARKRNKVEDKIVSVAFNREKNLKIKGHFLLPVIVQNMTLGLIESLQQGVLKVAQTQEELPLEFEEIRALGVHIRTLGLEHLVQTLTLKGAPCHRKVHKGHTRT